MALAQMFDHGLDPIKGWFGMQSLDKAAAADDPTNVNLVAGRCVYLSSTGTFLPGIIDGAVGIFLWQGAGSLDVLRDTGGVGGGRNSGLVCTGAYELETTEFVGATFPPNTPLTAEVATPGSIGKVKAGTLYTDQVIGVVSDGKRTNENGKDVIRFWTVWLPPTP